MKYFSRNTILYVLLLGFLLLFPLSGEQFYIRLFTRILIYGLCALSLDLILGYGGMVSFGHAAFLGTGAYTVGILYFHGISEAWIAWPAAVLVSASAALFIGAVSLRTGGAYFIMITLAFAQMLFYFVSGLSDYGGDDGMALAMRSSFGNLADINRHEVFYYMVAGILLLVHYLCKRMVESRFGMVIRGVKENERRMRSIGFPTYRYKLLCFVISGAIAGLAGALLANQSKYVSPSLMNWTSSGEILVMVILGGMGSLTGPVLGAACLLLAEEILSGYTEHWMLILGPFLICVVLFARGGLFPMIFREKKNE